MNRRQRNRRKYLTYSAGGVVASEAHVGFNRRPVGRWWPRSAESRFLDKVWPTRRSNGGGNGAPGLGNDCWLGRHTGSMHVETLFMCHAPVYAVFEAENRRWR